jgi:hypothetical protein
MKNEEEEEVVVTKSDHEFHCPGDRLRWNFFCFLHGIFEAFVKKQCESDLDEIFSLNSTFLFGYKLCFYDNIFQEKYSVIFSQYLKSILVLI